jgi:hypothetical protein
MLSRTLTTAGFPCDRVPTPLTLDCVNLTPVPSDGRDPAKSGEKRKAPGSDTSGDEAKSGEKRKAPGSDTSGDEAKSGDSDCPDSGGVTTKRSCLHASDAPRSHKHVTFHNNELFKDLVVGEPASPVGFPSDASPIVGFPSDASPIGFPSDASAPFQTPVRASRGGVMDGFRTPASAPTPTSVPKAPRKLPSYMRENVAATGPVHRFRLSGDVEESIEQLWNVRSMIEDSERNEFTRKLIVSDIDAISDSSCDTILDSVETVIKLHVSIREYAKTINAKIESLVQDTELRRGKWGMPAQRDEWCTAALDAATEMIDVIDTELANGLFCERV